MTYELAKQLKDTGFPQGTSSSDIHYTYIDKNNNPCSALVTDSAYIPTLSELIEACGDELCDLTRTDFGWMTNCENVGNSFQEEGKSLIEAVAKFWLKVNEKAP